MTELVEFVPFPKIARLNREVIVTEKIDGTNAQVWISEDGQTVRAAKRTGWVTLEDDNFGFARWVAEHAEDLKTLGPGRHFGEWWGSGIQRRYGLDHKRFSLFNVAKWSDPAVRPSCCHVVPVIWRGGTMPTGYEQTQILDGLRSGGSVAAPGFDKPEGIVLFHTASSQLFKVTLEKDEAPKGRPAA